MQIYSQKSSEDIFMRGGEESELRRKSRAEIEENADEGGLEEERTRELKLLAKGGGLKVNGSGIRGMSWSVLSRDQSGSGEISLR